MTGKHLHFSCIWLIHILVISHHFSRRVPQWASPYLALFLSFIPTIVRAIFGTEAKTKSLAPNTLEYGCGSLTFRYWKPRHKASMNPYRAIHYVCQNGWIKATSSAEYAAVNLFLFERVCVCAPWKDIYFGSISHFVCLARIISFIVRWNTNKAQPRCARAWAHTDKKIQWIWECLAVVWVHPVATLRWQAEWQVARSERALFSDIQCGRSDECE